jgi:Tol biopolymer transport system component
MKTTFAGRSLAWIILAALAAVSSAVTQNDDQAEVLMQAAHQKQLVDGQLDEAIELYKRIVQQHAGNRVLAARALLEMGQCYEKLGNTEARKAYERLLRDYGDQSEAATAARQRLAALGQPAGSGNGSTMMVRRVWAGPGGYVLGSVSPDGRYLSDVDWTTGDLALRDLLTGTTHRLTSEGLLLDEPSFSVISPDGKQVAYNWFNKNGPPDLRVVRVDGSASRVLYSDKAGLAFPTDWSPDGRYVLALLYRESNPFQIAMISVADGSVRVLKTLDSYSLKFRFSADGRYIAYDAPQKDEYNRDIFLLTADGSREIPLVEHSADDLLLGWTPDGRHVLFASDRSGTMSAWMIRMADGKPQGSPELVKQDIGQVVPLGFTRSGAFYYGVEIGTSDVYTAEFDPATGTVLTPPQNATQRFVGSNSSPAWSPDGQFLAYISSRTPRLFGHHPEVITIRSLKTGEERGLSHKLSFIWGPIRWSPDGRAILVPGKDTEGRHGLFLVDAQTAEVSAALLWEGSEISHPAWFPDGKRLLYSRGESGTTAAAVLVRDLETGRETEFYRPTLGSTIDDIALSPDGRQVALTLLETETRESALKVLPIAGGEASELVRAKEPDVIVGDSLSWSSDSRYIVFGRTRATGQERKPQLLAISSRGGEPHALGLAMDSVRSLSFDPTGHHVAFAAREGKDKVEVWVMENFLPAPKPAVPQPR